MQYGQGILKLAQEHGWQEFSTRIEKIRFIKTYLKHYLLNVGLILSFILEHGIIRSVRDIIRYPWIRDLLRVNTLLTKLGKGRTGRYHDATCKVITSVVSGMTDMLADSLNSKGKLVLHEDMVPPEILRAMGLSLFMPELNGIMLPLINPNAVEDNIDTAEQFGVPADICSLPKSTIGLALKNHLPPAIACVTSNLPCDGGMTAYTLMEKKLGIPFFRLDVPFDVNNERAIKYFANELRRMVDWLEINTPGKMDWNKLKTICDERNIMLDQEMELWDMIRARPAPMASEPVWLSHLWCFNIFPGKKKATKVITEIGDLARKNLEEGIPAIKKERFRALLWNPPLLHFSDLFNWAERTYGVALIMDSMSYNRLPYIDTSSEQKMLEGLGQTIMGGPMARHTRGPAKNYMDDIFHIKKQFDIDMLWVAGHIGCKNTAALNGMLRERCREEGLPLLIIDYDLSDPRIVPREGIIEQIDHFMENIMKADKLEKRKNQSGVK